ncbi:hypothetical protein ABW19_dt0210382 [Dactylella cylindrospora]|nr:hypothetical protein ABW19_dt0210382 [Dactylella cylindrospora]
MSLDSGMYRITSFDAGKKVGRFHIEDLSLLPKRIVGSESVNEEWIIENTGDGKYRFITRGAPVGEQDQKLFAFLIEGMSRPVNWEVNERDGGYEIINPQTGGAWISEADEHISVRPRSGSIHELFRIDRVDE